MRKLLTALLACVGLSAVAQTNVQPGLPISRYPRTTNLDASDIFIIARTNSVPPTNMGVPYLFLSNSIVTSIPGSQFETLTNGARIGLGTNNNWVFGVTGELSVATVSLGVDALSISNVLFTNGISFPVTNQFTTNVADVAGGFQTPVVGGLWFDSLIGGPFTNGQRRASIEWIPTNRSLRIGSVGNQGITYHDTIKVSNYWDVPNVGSFSYAFGSNNVANAPFAAILSGYQHSIYTQAFNSVIAGGFNSSIRTNASNSFIGSGNSHLIGSNAYNAFIGGGSANVIFNGSDGSFIGGGSSHGLLGRQGVIAGGFNNHIGTGSEKNDFSTVGGGEANTVKVGHAVISGGRNNIMHGNNNDDSFGVIGGGDGNIMGDSPISKANYSVIGGGRGNLIQSATDYNAIGGGGFHQMGIQSTNAFIGGGLSNVIGANGINSFILAGRANNLNAANAGIIGNFITNSTVNSIELGTFNTNKLRIDTNFLNFIEMGALFKSNVLAFHAPTAAQIGVGGVWIGNSNGSLVTLRTTDGSTTVMKIITP